MKVFFAEHADQREDDVFSAGCKKVLSDSRVFGVGKNRNRPIFPRIIACKFFVQMRDAFNEQGEWWLQACEPHLAVAEACGGSAPWAPPWERWVLAVGEGRGWAKGDFCFADSLQVWMPRTCSVRDCGVRPGRSVDWEVRLAVFSAVLCSLALKMADLSDRLLRGEDLLPREAVFSQGPRGGVWLPCISISSAPKQRFGWLMVWLLLV